MKIATIKFDRDVIDEAVVLRPHRGPFEGAYVKTANQPRGNVAKLRNGQMLLLTNVKTNGGQTTVFRFDGDRIIRWFEDAVATVSAGCDYVGG